MFFDVLALQRNVDVRHVDPGVIDTDMQATIRAAGPERFPLLDKFQALADEGRLQRPADVAERILADHFG
jgi:NAD(P)-dependent dehydrogenase (short-subunit alcohol dehydrogenase family)